MHLMFYTSGNEMKNFFIIIISLYYFALPTGLACTTMTTNGARLLHDRVDVWVSSNANCIDAGVNGEQLLRLTQQAIDQFWNKIPSSRLRFVLAGYWNQDVVRFETGQLCGPTIDCDDSTIPITNQVIISCNDNSANFSTTTYAKTSIMVDSDFISGANILLNNTDDSVFGNLSEKQKLWVIAHELGHAAGLGHSKNAANLMYFTLTPSREALGEEDYWGMTYLYPQNADGCGLVGSVTIKNDHNKTKNQLWLLSFLVGILSFIFLVIFQKVFLKRFKFIF
jgi:hypothetical protein